MSILLVSQQSRPIPNSAYPHLFCRCKRQNCGEKDCSNQLCEDLQHKTYPQRWYAMLGCGIVMQYNHCPGSIKRQNSQWWQFLKSMVVPLYSKFQLFKWARSSKIHDAYLWIFNSYVVISHLLPHLPDATPSYSTTLGKSKLVWQKHNWTKFRLFRFFLAWARSLHEYLDSWVSHQLASRRGEIWRAIARRPETPNLCFQSSIQ